MAIVKRIILADDKDSTFEQRRYIYDLSEKLGKNPPPGYRDFSKERASREIDRLEKLFQIKQNRMANEEPDDNDE